ncbi:hypothetical protein MA9V1_195 [Chryseobacterium phage MA9V-1]|nr:hypothetical protein MA9V1_195 [Chryseobacterium phage MA9V-1]
MIKTIKSAIVITTIALFAFGCGARKVDLSKHKEVETTEYAKENVKQTESNVQTNVTQSEKNVTTKQTEATKSEKADNTELNITIEPSGKGEVAEYEFVFGDKVFKGKTSGKLIVSNKTGTNVKDEKNVSNENANNEKNASDNSVSNVKASEANKESGSSENKVEDKTKNTDKKEPFIFNFMSGLAIVAGVAILGFLVYLVLLRFGLIKRT